MNKTVLNGDQSHLTLALPMKSPGYRLALERQLAPLTDDLFKAAVAIDAIHYARFVALSEKTMLYLADFDGKFERLLRDLAPHLWAMLDTIFQHVHHPPPTPLANNNDALP